MTSNHQAVLLAFWVDAEPVDRSAWLLWMEPGKQTEAEIEQPPREPMASAALESEHGV
jgi:hypothetical protein